MTDAEPEVAEIGLTTEESVLLLTCRAYLADAEEQALARAVRSSLDWYYVVWRSEAYRTTPLLWYHLRRLGLADAVPEPVRTYLEAWHALSAQRTGVLLAELRAILDAFDAAGIRSALLKGTALAPLLYPEPGMRAMLDLDLMIFPDDVAAAVRVMHDLQYEHAVWNPDTDRVVPLAHHQIAEYRAPHYELPAFMKRVRTPTSVPPRIVPRSWRRKHLKCFVHPDGTVTFAIFVDLHTNLSEGFDLEDVWRGASREPVLDRTAEVQSMTGMVWFLASRLYHEAFQLNVCKLSMFGDLHVILTKRFQDVDWNEVVRIAEKYGLQPSLFYVLTQLGFLTTARIPDEVLTRLRPNPRNVPASHDWGDILPKLLGRPLVHRATPPRRVSVTGKKS
jgi:hypothetical protein